MLVSDSDQFQLRGDDLAADAGDYSVEAGESFADVVGEFDVADDDLDVLCFEAVDEGGFGEEGVGGGLAKLRSIMPSAFTSATRWKEISRGYLLREGRGVERTGRTLASISQD